MFLWRNTKKIPELPSQVLCDNWILWAYVLIYRSSKTGPKPFRFLSWQISSLISKYVFHINGTIQKGFIPIQDAPTITEVLLYKIVGIWICLTWRHGDLPITEKSASYCRVSILLSCCFDLYTKDYCLLVCLRAFLLNIWFNHYPIIWWI